MNRLFTIGHSTRAVAELVALLQEHGVTQLVDVRHFPHSRRNPQANREVLELALPARGIAYVWEGERLGGLRAGGFTAYMRTDKFAEGLGRLEALLARGPTAIMCAEHAWARCHRRFIARQMAARGYRVTHIIDRGKPGYEESLSTDTQPPRIRPA